MPGDVDNSSADGMSERASVDTTLASLIEVVNNSSLEVGIRLYANGQVISGTLISARQYFEELAGVLINQAGEGEHDAARLLGQNYLSMSEDLGEELRFRRDNPDAEFPQPEHVHLRDGWAFTPGAEPLVAGLWRGRLSHIVGWALGSYSTSEE